MSFYEVDISKRAIKSADRRCNKTFIKIRHTSAFCMSRFCCKEVSNLPENYKDLLHCKKHVVIIACVYSRVYFIMKLQTL